TAAIGVTAEHHVPQVFPLNQIDDIVDVCFEVHARRQQVRALANPGQSGSKHVMSLGLERLSNTLPAPAPVPRAMHENECSHDSPPRFPATEASLGREALFSLAIAALKGRATGCAIAPDQVGDLRFDAQKRKYTVVRGPGATLRKWRVDRSRVLLYEYRRQREDDGVEVTH